MPMVYRHPGGTFARGGVFSTCPGTLFVRSARTTLPLLLTDSVGGIAPVKKARDHARPATLVCMESRVSGRRRRRQRRRETPPFPYLPPIRWESRVEGDADIWDASKFPLPKDWT